MLSLTSICAWQQVEGHRQAVSQPERQGGGNNGSGLSRQQKGRSSSGLQQSYCNAADLVAAAAAVVLACMSGACQKFGEVQLNINRHTHTHTMESSLAVRHATMLVLTGL